MLSNQSVGRAALEFSIYLPVDRLIAVYNFVLALLWLTVGRRAGYATWLAIAHGAALFLPWLLARRSDRSPRWLNTIHELYPLLFLLAFWIELDLVRRALQLENFDQPIAALDELVLGTHLHAVWMPAMSQVWFSELMHAMYFLYIPLIVVPPVVVLMQGRKEAMGDIIFRLMVTFLSCFLIYIVFPVDGPYVLDEMYIGPNCSGFFYRLVHLTHGVGDSLGCSFPSSHVAGATTIAILGWRWLPRWVAALLTVEAVGVLLSTFYTQKHYAIDAATGLLWALVVQAMLVPLLYRGLGWGNRWPRLRTYYGLAREASGDEGLGS